MLPKALIRSLYDVQHQRIQTGNRICAEIKVRLGQAPGKPEKGLSKEAKKYLENVREEFGRLADKFALDTPASYLKVEYEQFKILTDVAMVLFAQIYLQQLEHEQHMVKVVDKLVQRHPMWDAFLKDIKGCGPLMSAVILTEFNIKKASHISNFWKYAGLDVAADGRGRGRYKEHLIDQDYVDKDGEDQTKKGITFNPFLKTKLVGVLAPVFLKQLRWDEVTRKVYNAAPEERRKIKTSKKTGKDVYCIIGWEGKYRLIHGNYKHRLENHAKYGIQNDERKIAEAKAEKKKYSPKGHRNNMAIRYMIKIFLQDLWLAWRTVEKLPITKPYHEAVLGHKHSA